MSKVKRVQLDETTFIYVEATDETDTSEIIAHAEPERQHEEEETTRTAKGIGSFTERVYQRVQERQGQTMDQLIQTYTSFTLKAFKEVALAEVKSVTLEFGIKVDAQTGIPYIASGTAECSVKITVECAFDS